MVVILAALLEAKVEERTVEGVVTLSRSGEIYFFVETDSGEGWRMEDRRKDAVLPSVGDRVRVKGLTEAIGNAPRLFEIETDIMARKQTPKGEPEEYSIEGLYATALGPDAPERDWYAQRIITTGTITDINRRQHLTQLALADNGKSIYTSFAHDIDEMLPEDVAIGAMVRITGIGVYTTVRDPKTRTFKGLENISLSCQDVSAVEVLDPPPWWTARRLKLAVAFGLVALAGAIGWAMAMSARVRGVRREAEAVERERLRLSRDLHDNFQQLLAGTLFRLEAAGNFLHRDLARAEEQIDRAKASVERTQAGLRSVLWGLAAESEGPRTLSGLFRYAAGRLAHWEGVVSLSFSGDETAAARPLAGRLLMVLQEAVGNAIHHGKAKRVEVHVEFRQNDVSMTISDDGYGFNASARPDGMHLGIGSMQSRVAEMNGSFSIASEQGKGTIVSVKVPLTPND